MKQPPSPRQRCPYCGAEFPFWYWGISGHAGGYGTIKKYGLARWNFMRHVAHCEKLAKKQEEAQRDKTGFA